MSYQGKRVITGHDANGKSMALRIEQPLHTRSVPGAEFFEIWATSASPAPITADEPEPTIAVPKVHPAPGGSTVRVIDFLPANQGGVCSPMHRTRTVDYGIVLEGEMVLLLTDSEVHLKAGDIVIQRGTDHAWENRSERLARMAFILLDGEFAPTLLETLPDFHLMP
ncbi:MAG TPA: cupin domain-containing protein [Rhodocyclaceae bacterium]|nr:cupin domain-containing protein [Rhodocyclaceae bacterium]